MEIREKLIAILKTTGWSQEELARRLGISLKALNAWVNGKTAPREKNRLQIEAFYDDFVGRVEIDRETLEATEKKALATKLSLDELLENPELLKIATLYLTYHTNTIEGSTMTLADVEKVLDDENVVIEDKTAREQIEARNHRAAFLYLLSELKRQGKDFRWSGELIQAIHLRLMNGLIESAGRYRLFGVRIMGSPVPLVNYPSIPNRISILVRYMNSPCENPIERLADTHAAFEQVHPFGDGNGRTGRLIMFAQAIQYGLVPPLIEKERKRVYYKYLEIAQTRERDHLLRLFIAESILQTAKLLR